MKLDRIISVVTLVAALGALFLALKKPAPVMPVAQGPAQVEQNAQAFQSKMERLDQPKAAGSAPAEVRLNADEVNAAIAAAAGTLTAPPAATASSSAPSSGSSSTSQEPVIPGLPAELAAGGQPTVKDYQVNFEGDEVKGQFLTQVAGKDVWVTLKGHLGSKDGYATFDPTEFKVGDLNVPVSLVNDALQKKLAEQRDRLKLPDNVGGIKVENGEVVLTQR
jgi:hypothetical protein